MSVADKCHLADKEKLEERAQHVQEKLSHDFHPMQNGETQNLNTAGAVGESLSRTLMITKVLNGG